VSYINVAVLAHVDAGKTTVVEQLLYRGGALRSPGRVDHGTTQTDWLPVERARGISVRSATVVLTCGDVRVNILDTPGHMEFTGEAERALAAVDCAVLIVSAAEGIQSQTELFWRALRRLRMPTLLFVNKIDRTGCDPQAVLASIRKDFSPRVLPLNGPARAGAKDCGVVPAVFTDDDLLALCEADAALAERFLAGEPLPESDMRASFAASAAAGDVFPAVFGAASLGVGLDDLLAAMLRFLPRASEEAGGPVSGMVYKIEHDRALGKVAHIRLYSGLLRNRDSVALSREGADGPIWGKVTQIRRFVGAKREDMDALAGGDIAAVCGLNEARCRDIVGERAAASPPSLALPLFTVRVLGDITDPAPLLKAVNELADEDPLLDAEWEPETGELQVSVMGMIQLEVLAALLLERYGLAVSFSPPTVIYKETPLRSGVGFEAYTMPKPCWAVVKLQLDPLPRGAGYRFETVVPAREMLPRYQHHVEACLPRAMKQGLFGWQVTDCKVTLIGGEHHLIHTHPMDFFLATPMAFMDGLRRCGSQLLEPMQLASVTADEGLAGRLVGEILSMRGEVDSPVMRGGLVHMEALLPLAASMDFPVRLASLTGGRGPLRTSFACYRECPPELGAAAKRRGVNPLDRAKWILHNRNAL